MPFFLIIWFRKVRNEWETKVFFYYYYFLRNGEKYQNVASEANNGLKLSIHAVDFCIIFFGVCTRLTLPTRKYKENICTGTGRPTYNQSKPSNTPKEMLLMCITSISIVSWMSHVFSIPLLNHFSNVSHLFHNSLPHSLLKMCII